MARKTLKRKNIQNKVQQQQAVVSNIEDVVPVDKHLLTQVPVSAQPAYTPDYIEPWESWNPRRWGKWDYSDYPTEELANISALKKLGANQDYVYKKQILDTKAEEEKKKQDPGTSSTYDEAFNKYYNFIKENEGSVKDKKTGLFIPYPSPEDDGTYTVGYGHKLKKGQENNPMFKNGLTEEQAAELFKNDFQTHYKHAKKFMGKEYFNALPYDQQMMLTDYNFNTKKGLPGFPKFVSAIKAYNDASTEEEKEAQRRIIAEEYTRKYDDSTPLYQRNNRTLDNYLIPSFKIKKAMTNPEKYTHPGIPDPNWIYGAVEPIDDNRGQWEHPGEVTRIASNDITMQGVPYPVLGVGADGEQRMMYPNEEHTFNEAPVTEYPMMQAKRGGVTWLNEYAKGNTVYVSSATDPKYKRYKDSLDLYNYYKLQTQLENPSGGRMPGAGQGHEYNSVGDVMNTLSETGNTLYNMYSAVTPLTDEQKKNDEYLFRVASDIIKNNPDLTWGTDFPGIGEENYQAYKNAPEHSPDIKTKDGSIKATGTWMGYARNNNYANTQPTQTVVVAPPMSLKKGDVYKTQYGEYEIVGNPTPGAGVRLKNKKTGQESEVNYQDMASHIYNKDASVSTPTQQKTPPPTVVKTTTATTTPPAQQSQITTPPTSTQTPVTTPPQTVKKTTAPFKPKTGGFYAEDGTYWRFDEKGNLVPAAKNTNQGYRYGGETFSAGGEKHRVYRKESPTGNGEGVKGHIMVTHPTMDKGEWDTIDLTEKSGAKTVAEGIAATRKWHEENPEYQNGGYTTFLSPEHQFLQSIYSKPTNERNQYLESKINQFENITPEQYSYTPRYTKSQKFSMPTEKPIEIEDSFLDDLIFRNHHSDEKPAEETKEVLVEPTATTVTETTKSETPAKLSDKPQANKVSDKLMTAFQRSAEEYKKTYPNRPTPVISSGFRSREKQEQLYANRGNNPFPVAKPGTSKHEHGLAIDVGFTGAHTDQDYANFAAIMNKNGVKWLGSSDKVHFQLDEAAYGGWLNTYE